MTFIPKFPTRLHQDTAELIRDYFLTISNVDTVLVVNSCARGQAVPESDLDFAILVKPGTTVTEIKNIHTGVIRGLWWGETPRGWRPGGGMAGGPSRRSGRAAGDM